VAQPPEMDIFAVHPPTDQALVKMLSRGRLRTRLVGCSVGVLSGGLGVLMLALIGFQLDPEVAHMPLAGKLVGVGFAVLFCLVGLLMVGMAILGKGGGSADLQKRFLQAPDSIVRARRVVSTSRGVRDPGAPGMVGQHTLVITADDDTEVRVMMGADDVSAVLLWVQHRVPTAVVEGG